MNKKLDYDLYKFADDGAEKKDDILNNIMQKAEQIEKSKKNRTDFKRIARFALPAMMILAIIFIPIFHGNTPLEPANTGENEANAIELPKSGNRFLLVAYASNDTSDDDGEISVEITRDIKIKLPFFQATDLFMMSYPSDSTIPVSFNYAVSHVYSRFDSEGFKVEGENIKSINFESRNGRLITKQKIDYLYDDGGTGVFYIPTLFDTVYVEGEELFDLRVKWFPYEFQGEVEVNEPEIYEVPHKADQYIFKNDIITITVMFHDGEVITQIVEMTKDEYGYIYARIIE